jgi:hypothetical protein
MHRANPIAVDGRLMIALNELLKRFCMSSIGVPISLSPFMSALCYLTTKRALS